MLDEIERRLVMALQEGLPLFIRPFSVLASRVGCEENDVLERIRQWSAEGVIKRFGVVVRPQTLAAQGDALTIAARLALPAPPAGVIYRRLTPRSHRKIALAALRFDKLSPAAAAFVDVSKKARKSLVMD